MPRLRRTLMCLVVVGAAWLMATVGVAAAASCPVSPDPARTLAALQTCNQSQLDALFTSLDAGPMPAYGSTARGYWRFFPQLGNLVQPANLLVDEVIWQGKVFYTHADGGYLTNRVLGANEAFKAAVTYAPGYLDGKRSISVDYGAENDPLDLIFHDEIRMVQPGIYLGNGWGNRKYPWAPPLSIDRVTFLLDFLHPDIPAPACILCALLGHS